MIMSVLFNIPTGASIVASSVVFMVLAGAARGIMGR
jgi:hypothetical protein